MSEENVELVRRVHAGWARGDFRVGADLLASDFEWHQMPQAVEPGTRRRAEVAAGLRNIFEIYEHFRVEAEEFIDAGDQIVVIGRSRGTARGSGLKLDDPVAVVWTVRGAKLASVEFFRARREALEAVGLPE